MLVPRLSVIPSSLAGIQNRKSINTLLMSALPAWIILIILIIIIIYFSPKTSVEKGGTYVCLFVSSFLTFSASTELICSRLDRLPYMLLGGQ